MRRGSRDSGGQNFRPASISTAHVQSDDYLEPPMPISKSSSTDITVANCNTETEINMSNDLIMEILVRLPFKPMMRFKCVSKSWCEIISDDFVRRRLPLLMSAVYFPDDPEWDRKPRYACATDARLEDCDTSFFPFHGSTVILDACYSLLLYCSPPSMEFYVVNPMVRRWVALPRPLKEAHLSMLAFDPYNSPHYYVINFTGWREQGAILEVFSSETGMWVEHNADFGLRTCTLSASTHYYDGIFYILVSPKCIVCMNLAKFACTQIELPEPMDRDGRIGHYRGRLHYMNIDGEQLKIWMLKDLDACEWDLKHVIRVKEIVKEGGRARELKFLTLHPEMEVVYLWLPWKLVSYDLRKKEIEKTWEFAEDQKDEKNHVIKIWLFPFSSYSSDCLPDDLLQCHLAN